MKKVVLILSALLTAAALAYPQSVIFKLSGGLNGMNGSDLNAGLTGESGAFKAAFPSAGGGFETLSYGLGGQIEIITTLGTRFGLGLGGGYNRVSKISRIAGSDAAAEYNARVSVLPFFINVHYWIPLAENLQLDAFAGPVFAIVQFNTANPTTSALGNVNKLVTFTASQTSLGGQLGLGLSYRLGRGLAVIADGYFRLASVGNLQGNWTQSGASDAGAITGSSSEYFLWTYQSGGFQRLGYFDNNGPSDPAASAARKAEISLTGLALAAGIRLSF
jgi:hypothetical protein